MAVWVGSRGDAANRAAAAVCWAVGRANGSVSTTGGVEARRLEEWFGVKGSIAERARVFLAANGIEQEDRTRSTLRGRNRSPLPAVSGA